VVVVAVVTAAGLNSRAWMGLAKAIKDGNRPQDMDQDMDLTNATLPTDTPAPLTALLTLVQGYMTTGI